MRAARPLALAALTSATVLAIASGARAAEPATGATLTSARAEGASAATMVTMFRLSGTPAPSRVHAYVAPDARLVLSSPEGIAAPGGGSCRQDAATQVSCDPGSITAIVGDMAGGADSFSAGPSLGVAIGIRLAGADSALVGGGGRDRIEGGAADDLIRGGAGRDRLHGGAGSDLLWGGGGADRMGGGPGPDALQGGGGPDKLSGGPGRDLCVGGGGRDTGRSCFVHKAIP